MGQRQGTILKKCKCVSQERCSHKWTLRYWADGRQREASFADELDGQGRPVETTNDPPLCWTDGVGQADPGHLRLRGT